MTNPLRETATNGMTRGQLVRKGNGSTVYRIWGINPAGEVAVCKATTKTTPTRGSFYPADTFRVADVAGPADTTDSAEVKSNEDRQTRTTDDTSRDASDADQPEARTPTEVLCDLLADLDHKAHQRANTAYARGVALIESCRPYAGESPAATDRYEVARQADDAATSAYIKTYFAVVSHVTSQR